MQCETLLGLARESTKKRRNEKFGECITTIRYNVSVRVGMQVHTKREMQLFMILVFVVLANSVIMM